MPGRGGRSRRGAQVEASPHGGAAASKPTPPSELLERSQDALRVSEARFRALIEHAPDGIFFADDQGRYLDVNSIGCAMLGYSRDELLALRVDDVVIPEEQTFVAPELAAIASGGSHLRDWLFRRKDGSAFTGEVHARLFPDGNVVAIVRDVSERKQMELQLREREHFLGHVLDAEPGVVYVYDLAERRNTYINRHWLSAYGYTADETQAYGSALLQRVFHPEDLARIEAHHEAFRDAADAEMRTIEYRVRTKEGAWSWLLSRERPFARDASGRVSQILGIAHDVTERRLAEAAIARDAARRKVLFEQAKDGIFVIDESRRVVEANASFAAMLGYTPDEVLSLHPWDWDEVYTTRAALLAAWPELSPVAETFETRIRRKDGAVHEVEISGTPLELDGQKVVLCVCRDITGRNRLRRAAEETARQLRELSTRLLAAQEDERRRVARELHDELGQTLTALKLRIGTRLALGAAANAESDDAKIRMIDDAIAQVRRLALALRPSMLDDLGLVPALRWIADQAAEHTGFEASLSAELVGERPAAEIETACFRIGQEAITNVTRHAAAKRLTVELLRDGRWLVLSVQDDGCGFDAGKAGRLRLGHERFGLLGMEERASLAGGRLEIESALGLGTRVRAWLPWHPRSVFDTLSPREREVFQLAAEGLSNADVGQRLFISPRTAETHRARVMDKLRLSSQTELVRFAVRRGTIEA